MDGMDGDDGPGLTSGGLYYYSLTISNLGNDVDDRYYRKVLSFLQQECVRCRMQVPCVHTRTPAMHVC